MASVAPHKRQCDFGSFAPARTAVSPSLRQAARRCASAEDSAAENDRKLNFKKENMDTKEQLKKNAEFVLAKFADNFEISKVSPCEEVIDKELGNDYKFSFEIVTYASDKTPNKNGIPFTVTVSSDDYVDLCRDDINTCIMGFPIEDLKDPHFFDNFFEAF